MSVTTLMGEVDKSVLGVVLPHEHSCFGVSEFLTKYDDWEMEQTFNSKVSLENLGLLTRNPYAVRDNNIMDCPDVLIDEIFQFKKAGGGTWVDLSGRRNRFSRNIRFTYEIALKTGLHVVAGTGYGLDQNMGRLVDTGTLQDLVDQMMTDITVGIDGTPLRAGVIGEVGTGKVITEREKKALEAACIVQKQTGVGMQIHAYLYNREGLNVVDFVKKQGVDLQKVCINHVDVQLDMEYIYKLLDQGVYIEFDNLGKEFYCDARLRNWLEGRFAYDFERTKALKELVDRGYVNQILLSSDLCLKSMMHKFGGWGYDHLLTNFYPMMLDCGITKDQAMTMMVDNPANFLDK